ncbi:MAG: hypothetical protein ACXACP_12875, partial [Candidatus Hodarchaeales archaeon]
RNYIPHLIALSASSPFLNQKTSGKIVIKEKNGKKQVISRGLRSYRLAFNTGQMGPNIPQYLPIIDDRTTRKDFSSLVKKAPPDDRMIDLFPFTDYSTLELRFFDAQPWAENRLAMVLLIQALAQKTKELIKQKKPIPAVSSKSLYENRRKSIQFGLLAQFTRDNDLTGEFNWFYNYDIEKGVEASKLLHSFQALLIFIEDELINLGSPYLNYLLLPVLGSKQYAPPFTVSDYLCVLYEESNSNILSFMKKLYYSEKNRYAPVVDGDYSSFVVENVPDDLLKKKKVESKLSTILKNDLTSRKTQQKVKKPAPKKIARKPAKRKKIKPKLVKEPIKLERTPAKAEIKDKPIAKKKPPIAKAKRKVKDKPVKAKPITTIPIARSVVKEKAEPGIISAFDENEDLEIYSPMIEIEPKYQKINSKIANVMRTRRKEIEAKRVVFFKSHLKEEEVDFNPFPRKRTADFPALISGSVLFGFIELSFSNIKTVMYKFRNNPITIYFFDKSSNKEIAKLRTYVDIASIERRQKVRIPCSIDIGNLKGKIRLRIEAVTSTNERLLPKDFTFSFTRKDEIGIVPQEFYITGNYGPVECIYKAKNSSKSTERGELSLLLATQSMTNPIVIYETKFSLKPKETFELARTIDLSVDYQHSSFYIIARATTGVLKKNRTFKAIHVPVLREIVIDWSFEKKQGTRNDLWQGVEAKTRYEVDFVFHFLRDLPLLSIRIFVNTYPTGETKRLASARMKRYIDKGDEFTIPNVKFKTPKNCGYIVFDIQIRTEKGILPLHLVSEPIGIHALTDKRTFEKRLDLDL